VTATAAEAIPVDESILPLGSLGIVAPMDSLGFALNTFIGVVYDEVVALLPAQALVFSFQQRRAGDDARRLPYDRAASRSGVQVIRFDDIVSAELVKPVTGHRLVVELAGGRSVRWILQAGSVDEARALLADRLGDRFTDATR
jgi:hypothetical protein